MNQSATKITKGQIDATLAAGITRAKLTNKGVNRRMLKANKKEDQRKAVHEAKTKQADRRLDQFLKKQEQQLAERKFSQFEADVADAAKQAEINAPLGETFGKKEVLPPTEYIFTDEHGGTGKAIPIPTTFDTIPEPAPDHAGDHTFSLPA